MGNNKQKALNELMPLIQSHIPGARCLGVGDESVVFTDGTTVYKMFKREQRYYSHIGCQLVGRFSGCKRLFDIDMTEIGGHTVFTYPYHESKAYSGGRREELLEFIAECCSRGVVQKDLKPINFRVFDTGIVFIDYGRDFIPYSELDLVNMCLRAYLCLTHWADPTYLEYVRSAQHTWIFPELEGFADFMTEAYSKVLKYGRCAECKPFKLPENRWIEQVFDNNKADPTNLYCLSNMSHTNLYMDESKVDDIQKGNVQLLLDSPFILDSLVKTLEESVPDGGKLELVISDPFFHPQGDFQNLRKHFAKSGFNIVSKKHSEPRPSVDGAVSEYMYIECIKSPPEPEKVMGCIPRSESAVFIIRGHDVSKERFLRCWGSIINQTCDDWGAVIVNDHSDEDLDLTIREFIEPYRNKVTYIKNTESKPILQNIVEAIRDHCSNPDSIIILLDMDDSLLSKDFLSCVEKQYLRGHDMVSTQCIKEGIKNIPYVCDYTNPRNEKAGDVWVHAKTFKKYLFDAVRPEDFLIDGEMVEPFNELTFMVPISEMASSPIQIKAPLYLWTPSGAYGEDRKSADQKTKEIICSKRPYDKLLRDLSPGYIRHPGDFVGQVSESSVILMRHGEKEFVKGIPTAELGLTPRGETESRILGQSLPRIGMLLTSPVIRAFETAWCIREGNKGDCEIRPVDYLRRVPYTGDILSDSPDMTLYDLYRIWSEGQDICTLESSFKDFSIFLLRNILEAKKQANGPLCIVTHDHMIVALSYIFGRSGAERVPYLGGLLWDESLIESKLSELK